MGSRVAHPPSLIEAGTSISALPLPKPASVPARIEFILAGHHHPVCAPNRVLLRSGAFWSGYRLEMIRAPASGVLEKVSTPHHRIVYAVNGTCTVRYRAYLHEGCHRLAPGSLCFMGRGYVFERLAWKGSGFEAIMVDIVDLGTDPNPVDAFGRTDALFDMYMGINDARIATLIDLMRAEIDLGCPTGGVYGEALSLALASRVASLCTSMPGRPSRAATLTAKQLQRVTDYIRANLPHQLTIARLATLVNMSPFHFARCFKQTTRLTPHQFVIRERIACAREMLSLDRNSVGNVAMALGFASQSHFANVYRRITGSVPSRDRTGR